MRVTYPTAVRGDGIEIIDSNGKRYIDASGGAAVSCLGQGHPAVIKAMHAQIDQLAYAHTSFFTTDIAERLADRLIEDAPAGMTHVYLVAGGSEAITMLADGNGDFASALGLEMDGTAFGMGKRGQRFSLVVNDGFVEQVNVEAPGDFNVSSAEHMLGQL